MAEALNCEAVDVAVVGAGFAGSAFAARLAEQAPGLRILCLERGGWVDRAAMPARSRQWQRAAVGAGINRRATRQLGDAIMRDLATRTRAY